MVRKVLLSLSILAIAVFSISEANVAAAALHYSGPQSVPAVALTFDDGPHPFGTEALLDIMDDLGIKGSFFIVGKQAVQFPGILAEIAARGHSVANHTWSHRNITLLSKDELFDEIAFCSQAIEAITGSRPRFFRPPGGRWDKVALSVVEELGLSTILWDVNGRDMTVRTPGQIAATVINSAKPGSVILLHGGLGRTMEAIPLIVEGLRKKGFYFVALDQMFHFTPAAREPLRGPLDRDMAGPEPLLVGVSLLSPPEGPE